ncbi:ExbD/TolR family protein [Hymenobacter latericus]|uniref:ExbD/TolR family protein n=1 Tax=Hymenobacter sp. YIM 151858-1 TaxID=2987688 RepID=UPI0022273CE1|nr:biopolymer transporter ExbD [Hymenobacter sp. YIM 151858-1]UYZ58722.1 biopolymer transporter ExbD [Hymenobacter sp. YIM 151858-1]
MPKVKPHRTSPSLDMTPMVDLAFLLVTFFMLTATPSEDVAVVVDTPSSTSEKQLPEKNVVQLTIDKDKRVFFSMSGQPIKIKTLDQIAGKYNLTFTPAQKQRFAALPDFGVPVQQLPAYLSLSTEDRKAYKQPGIPYDSLNNQMIEWVMAARTVSVGQFQQAPYIAIKGDGQADVPTVKDVIESLQEKKLNRFYLITDLEMQPVASK